MHDLIVGCGDIGRRVARITIAGGRSVAALARSDASAKDLVAQGISVFKGDLDRPESLPKRPENIQILYHFAPPPPTGRTEPRLEALLSALERGPLPEKLVYISTSGVYGDCGGAWVDEDWPLNPQSERAIRRVAAEMALRDWGCRLRVPVAILRVPGIYGPGRLPIERLRRGIPVVRQEESPYSNRIHAEDLAAACISVARDDRPMAVYNVSDGHPTTMTDYFNRVADALKLPRPPAISRAEARLTFTPSMLSFLQESKRLDNRRLLSELGFQLRYPSLEEGLAASLPGPEHELPAD